jgi:hypothetical protein
MTIEYTWAFGPLTVKIQEDDLQNVVYIVNWRLAGADGEFFASTYGSVQVPPPGGDFVPFDQLTEELVQQWVEDALGQNVVDEQKAYIAEVIEFKKHPTTAVLPAPWNKVENDDFNSDPEATVS